MLDRETQKAMAEEQKFFGINPGFKQYSPFPFGSMNQQASRQGMEDNEFFVRENFIKTGPGKLRTLWDQGEALYTASGGLTIVYFFFFNISSTYYVAIFLSDGSAVQVNTETGDETSISSAGAFYTGTQLPICCQSGSQYLLIANNITSDSYWIWDGEILYTAGTLGPVETITNGGSAYTSAPTVTVYGGSGSGAAVTAQINSGAVVSLEITNPGNGYLTGEHVQLLFTGGGSDNGARLTAVLTGGIITSVTINNGGTGFNFAPTLTVVGGGGTGAILVAVLTAGVITSITITNGGTGFTSVPAITIQSGANRAAAGTITLMPFGVSGSSLETFQSRVWLPYPNQIGHEINGGTFLVSTPGSLTDFAVSNGGVIFNSTDSFLRAQYVNIKQSNGYLYPIGDSSVSVISNVQTTGNPSTTTFNYQNTDPQTGTIWRDSVQAYSRTILFTNVFGVFGLYGGAVTKISSKMDDIFDNLVLPTSGGVTPTGAVANIFNLKAYLVNLTTVDPITQDVRTIMVAWDERDWFVVSQNSAYTFIGTQEINSDMLAWGTDGTSVYPLFDAPSSTLEKRLATKLYGQANFLIQKESMGVYMQAQDLSENAQGVAFSSIKIDAEHGAYDIPEIPPFPSTPPPYYATIAMGSGDVTGVNLGLELVTSSPDFALTYLGLGYIEVGSMAMGSTPIEGQIQTQ